jgi:Zn-dependent membrane protease YugP
MTTKQLKRRCILIAIAWLLFMAGSIMCCTEYLLASISLFMSASVLLAINSSTDYRIIKELEKCKICREFVDGNKEV